MGHDAVPVLREITDVSVELAAFALTVIGPDPEDAGCQLSSSFVPIDRMLC
jgi:hypothetical protein